MKKIVPSTPCEVDLVLRKRSGSQHREAQKYTKFGYIRDGINLALAMYDEPADPVQTIDVYIKIGA